MHFFGHNMFSASSLSRSIGIARLSPQIDFKQVIVLVCLFFNLTSVFAQNHITRQAWFDDPTGHLSWAQVMEAESQFQNYEGVLSRGFGASTIWLKLTIDPHASASDAPKREKLVLRIRPVYLDQIEIYDPLLGHQPSHLTGDRFHPKAQEIQGLDFMVSIPSGEQARDIWVKVKSTSTRQISIQALNLDELNSRIHTQELLYALYIGVILVFFSWAAVHWMFSREPLVGLFSLTQFSALIYALCGLGYARVFWPVGLSAQWLDFITSLFSILAVSSAVAFHVLHLREFQPPERLQWAQKLLLLLLPLKLGLLLAGHPRIGLHINMIEVLISPNLFLLSVVLSKGWTPKPQSPRPALKRAYIIGFYALLWVIIMIAVLPGLALTSGGEIPLYIVQAHGLFTAFLIMVMLQYRDRVMRKKQNDMVIALESSLIRADHEKQMREEQEKLLSMLAHELKTPLATVQMRLNHSLQGSKEIRAAVRDMDNVIERCVQTLQMSDQKMRPHLTSLDWVGLLNDCIKACAQPERIESDFPTQLLIESDHQLLSIVINNLLENACKYANAEARIRITLACTTDAESTGAWAVMEVSNPPGAAGWPDPQLIFEKYYRSPNARRQAGTGLGLYLVRNLTQVLNGRIEYLPDHELLKFRLSLPIGNPS